MQRPLFPPALPPGFSYHPEIVTREEEGALLALIETLPFGEVRLHGVVARRRVIQFGRVRYGGSRIEASPPPPPLLADLRARCARLAGIPESVLEQMMVTFYPPGSAIGWHRDSPLFGSPVAGVSLASPTHALAPGAR